MLISIPFGMEKHKNRSYLKRGIGQTDRWLCDLKIPFRHILSLSSFYIFLSFPKTIMF